MKATKIQPSDPANWTAPPLPVEDGPHRKKWKASPTACLVGKSGNVAQSSATRHEEDIDTNGYYQNALRALEE